MNPARFRDVFPSFRTAPTELVREILESCSPVRFQKGAHLYSEDDPCSGIGFFLSGAVRVYKISENGREITLYEISPGETCILNASCILSRSRYPALAQALSDGEALLMPEAVFRRLVRESDEMRAFIFSLFSDRLSLIMELVEEVAFGRMDERLADYLLEKSAEGTIETTHQAIANHLGTSREVVSRLLKQMEQKGEVSLYRNRIELRRLRLS